MEIVRDKPIFSEYFETVRHVISSRRSRLLDSPLTLPLSVFLVQPFDPLALPPPSPAPLLIYTPLFHSLPLVCAESSAGIEFSR